MGAAAEVVYFKKYFSSWTLKRYHQIFNVPVLLELLTKSKYCRELVGFTSGTFRKSS